MSYANRAKKAKEANPKPVSKPQNAGTKGKTQVDFEKIKELAKFQDWEDMEKSISSNINLFSK